MKEFEKWFKKAEGDLMIIQNIVLLPDSPYDLCCFHAQQASEKYLKAYLIAKHIDFPKTHDLVELNKLCSNKNIKFGEIRLLCVKLKDYSIAHVIRLIWTTSLLKMQSKPIKTLLPLRNL